jgi:diaminohydroxyphosphoribosylaminopyrimidine deaminase / 5-amino-6-(5-phosphoribosylamino)uracil reductase
MNRCIALAQMGAGRVAPNPMVGAVLVYGDRIIGEGYHRAYGEPHAEVNCIASVIESDRHLIPLSTLYVSLEPCAHHGKTPPCADLIIRNKIPTVVVGVRDPFPAVDGKGIEKLRSAGVEVVVGVLGEKCAALNRRFFVFHTQQRPYIILKWAQTADAKIAGATSERLFISGDMTNRLVHKWRSEEAAILVGTNTARLDDPALNLRLWQGTNPVRMVLDLDLSLPATLKLFDGSQRTIVFNKRKHKAEGNIEWVRLGGDKNIARQVIQACYELDIQSLIVEGGAKLLRSFIAEGCWDEARVITNKTLFARGGLPAPVLPVDQYERQESLAADTITYYTNTHVKPA